MGGGGSTATITEYEKERQGVSKRAYGELASDGIQSREQYEMYKAAMSGKGMTQKDFKRQEKYVTGTDYIAIGENEDMSMATRPENYKAVKKYGTRTVDDVDAYNNYRKSTGNLKYDSTYKRWSLDNGVDLDAALADWENYELERKEIQKYEAKEERHKAAPSSLTGTSGKVDYSLAATKDSDKKKSKKASALTIDESPSTASTNQSLGIY
jgi:hypothetical protein